MVVLVGTIGHKHTSKKELQKKEDLMGIEEKKKEKALSFDLGKLMLPH